MLNQYYISQAITTEESAVDGDFAEWQQWTADSLRDALKDVNGTRTSAVGGVESFSANYAEYGRRFTFNVHNSAEYETGEQESRALHIHGITRASAGRLSRLLGVRLENF